MDYKKKKKGGGGGGGGGEGEGTKHGEEERGLYKILCVARKIYYRQSKAMIKKSKQHISSCNMYTSHLGNTQPVKSQQRFHKYLSERS